MLPANAKSRRWVLVSLLKEYGRKKKKNPNKLNIQDCDGKPVTFQLGVTLRAFSCWSGAVGGEAGKGLLFLSVRHINSEAF